MQIRVTTVSKTYAEEIKTPFYRRKVGRIDECKIELI